MKKNIFLFTLTYLFFISHTRAQIEFKYNNVDTISTLNKEIIKFFKESITAKVEHRENLEDSWIQSSFLPLKGNDSYMPWIYDMFSYSPQTILGISKQDEHRFKIKVQLKTGVDTNKLITYSIQNFMVKKTDSGYFMEDILNYQLKKEGYRTRKDNYFIYYLPKTLDSQNPKLKEINAYVKKIERYFEKEVPFRMRYVFAPTCEDLYNIRGYDYVANMMSAKTTTCGLTDAKNRIVYSSSQKLHKHELLRLLIVMFPEYPDILMDGFTNLVGGASGRPIIYHLKKLAPYIIEHPKVLDDLASFYYFDDETSPHFVFNAIATNYFIKLHGEEKLKEMMRNKNNTKTDLSTFLNKYCNVEDERSFWLDQFTYYGIQDNQLEYVNLL